MSVTLEFSDNVSRSTCAKQHPVKLQKNISQFQYIVDIERIIMDTLGGINKEHTIEKVTAERRRIYDDWHSHNYVRIVADILSCMIGICSSNLKKTVEPEDTKLVKEQCRLDMRKYSFSQRVINEWNKLPNYCVNASSVNMFKNRIDRYFIRLGYT